MKKINLDVLTHFNVLYLEDEANLLRQTTTVLEDFVGEIYPCSNIAQAKETLSNKNVHIIISDILLENSTGIEFLAQLREEGCTLPIIFTTAYADTKYLLEAIKLKAEGYIIKPINIKELLNLLYETLLSKIKDKELEKSECIIKTVAAVTGTKAVEIIKFIVSNLDNENIFNHTYSDIMENIEVSKPTVIKLFKQLSDFGILVKIQNSKYKFNPEKLENMEIL